MDKVRLTFTVNSSSEAFAYLSTYEIQTDESIFPFESVKSVTGYSLDKILTNSF